MIGFGDAEVQCSAAGCRGAAVWRVNWRNPRIHPADRVKVWLACDAHRDGLGGYLASRGFPTLITDLDEVPELVPDAS